MTQEDKQLLIKDLCARLPYGVKVSLFGWDKFPCTVTKIDIKLKKIFCPEANCYQSIDVSRPYLRPMSSMTEEECTKKEELFGSYILDNNPAYIDWLNAHHFDYRGLIEKGLALEAPEEMYKDK